MKNGLTDRSPNSVVGSNTFFFFPSAFTATQFIKRLCNKVFM